MTYSHAMSNHITDRHIVMPRVTVPVSVCTVCLLYPIKISLILDVDHDSFYNRAKGLS